MNAAGKVAALLETLQQADVEDLPPAERERLAFLFSRWANVARIRPAKSGVLATLGDGQRGH